MIIRTTPAHMNNEVAHALPSKVNVPTADPLTLLTMSPAVKVPESSVFCRDQIQSRDNGITWMNPITAGDPGESQGMRVRPSVGVVTTMDVSRT